MKASQVIGSLCAVFTVLAVMFFTAGPASASVFKSGGKIQISNLHQIDDDFYAACEQLSVDGTIQGDLFAAASDITIRGEVTQSATVAAQNIVQSGTIGGSIRAFAQNVDVDGQIGRSAVLFGAKIGIGQGANIARDLTAAGGSVSVDGIVGGNAKIEGDKVYITGEFDGDVEIKASLIEISPPAVINGNLTYTTKVEDSLKITPGVDIRGETIYKPPKPKEQAKKSYTSFILRISSMFAAFIFGVIVVRLFRPYAMESFHQLKDRFVMSSAAGLLGLLGLIFFVIILVISAFFLLIGLLMLDSESGLTGVGLLFLVFSSLMIPITTFASVTGGIILYSGKVIVAYVLGFLIIRAFTPKPKGLSATSLFVGLIILLILFTLPYVGTVVWILATIIGAGAILLGIRHCRKERTPEAESPTPADQTPPQPIPPQ